MKETRRYAKLESVTYELSKFDIMGYLIKADKVPANFRLTEIDFDSDSELLTLKVERVTEEPTQSDAGVEL